ncbi:hypothetical protein ACFPAF_15350 [Hymenobacter endophyticus]|uniref:YcxB family protein n=1 Tax=Hymenobacter endophyticus TaxID=3076335 RepID=A0ABU3TK87_9BACT|nr:hypothetical protein [Hymenobacter endophyticus]MDU0371778.1 hypothetical protein [Hymenobacter endophyticus]
MVINLPATPPTFPEYQLIHRTQERQRILGNATPAPAAKSVLRHAVEWLGCVVLVILLLKLLISDFNWPEWWGWLLSGKPLIAIAVFWGVTLFANAVGALRRRRQYYCAFREQASSQPLSINIESVGITVQWPQDWQFLPWHSLTRVQQVGDWLLLYPGPNFAYYLDLRQVPEPYTSVDVLALIGKREESGPAATFAS